MCVFSGVLRSPIWRSKKLRHSFLLFSVSKRAVPKLAEQRDYAIEAKGVYSIGSPRKRGFMTDRKWNDEPDPASAGQSGDNEQLSDIADADSESVEELVEEGNAFEAGIIQGVEDARTPDQSEVRTREVPEDDVPEEYLNDDNPAA